MSREWEMEGSDGTHKMARNTIIRQFVGGVSHRLRGISQESWP